MSITPVRSWTPSPAHARASLLGIGGVAAAVLFRVPTFLVFAFPFALIALWSSMTRPTRNLGVVAGVGPSSIREGQATTWSAAVTELDGVDLLVALVPERRWLKPVSRSGVAMTPVGPRDSEATLAVSMRATRWGQHELATANVVGVSSWGAYRWHGLDVGNRVTALPLPDHFDANGTAQRGEGLVGVHRSTKPGDGYEFAGIRPFVTGDRLRRINWRRSVRDGELHVTATYSERDIHVTLVVDGLADFGASGGIDGEASSLDTTVRAAGSLAEHFLLRGDRVSLQILGGLVLRAVKPASGPTQLRRILDTLAMIDSQASAPWAGPRSARGAGGAIAESGSMVIMVSPLISPIALERVNTIASHGIGVAVIDTLPSHAHHHPDPTTEMAWRLRILERQREMRAVQRRGVAVLRWQGPGSIDPFLREIARRASAPRLAKR